MSSRSQGFQNQFQLVNAIGGYTIKGIDILVNKQFNNFGTWLSYTYSKNDFEFDNLNNNEAFPNNLDLRHIVNFSTTYEIENLKLSAGVNWRTGKPYTEPSMSQLNSGALIYESPNAKRMPDYIRTDISARYSFEFAEGVNAEAGASIWNVLNKRNIVNRFYSRDANDPITQNDEFALRLTSNFSFRLKF